MGAKLHDRLEQLAKANRLKPAVLGTRAGLSADTVNQWIRKSRSGKDSGRSRELGKLADHYKVTLDWLLGKSNDGGPVGIEGVASQESMSAEPGQGAVSAMIKVADAVAEDSGLEVDRAREIVGRVAMGDPAIADDELLLFRAVMRLNPGGEPRERGSPHPKEARRSSPARS